MRVIEKSKEHKILVALYTKLLRSDSIEFENGLKTVPVKQGVYVIYKANGVVLHVGRTYRRVNGLFGRLNSHSQGTSSFMKNYDKITTKSLKKCFLKFITVKNDRLRALLEIYTAGMLCPRYLGLHKLKKEKITNRN